MIAGPLRQPGGRGSPPAAPREARTAAALRASSRLIPWLAYSSHVQEIERELHFSAWRVNDLLTFSEYN